MLVFNVGWKKAELKEDQVTYLRLEDKTAVPKDGIIMCSNIILGHNIKDICPRVPKAWKNLNVGERGIKREGKGCYILFVIFLNKSLVTSIARGEQELFYRVDTLGFTIYISYIILHSAFKIIFDLNLFVDEIEVTSLRLKELCRRTCPDYILDKVIEIL